MIESNNIKNFLVKFTFEIPVKVIRGKNSASYEEEAYYKARDEFCEFNVNESEIKITDISEEEYQSRRDVVNKLHNFK